MAVLNSWQKITRVIPNKPFGTGKDGALTISSNQNLAAANASCSGTSSSTTLTLGAASTFQNGDVVIIHQSRGSGANQWEVNRIVSGAGTTTLTLQAALQYTYTDSGSSQAQVAELLQHTTVTISSGAQLEPIGGGWNEDTGGLLPLAAKVLLNVDNGTLLLSGRNGSTGADPAGGVGRGFSGGQGIDAAPTVTGYQGEGTAGARTQSTTANGNGGGAGSLSGAPGGRAGGGGGNASAGSNASTGTGTGTDGTGGASTGTADLISMGFGGGGGGGARESTNNTGSGGGGGAMAFLYAREIRVNNTTGSITLNGGLGGDVSGQSADGGSGAGGSCLVVCQTGSLGTTRVTATGGAAQGEGGAGSDGRIAVHRSSTVTGTTSPTFYNQLDPTLFEKSGGFLFNLL